VPALLQQVNEEQALAAEQERQILRQEEDWKSQSKVETFELKALVDDTLVNRQIPLCEKMHRLSWFCLSDAEFRPTNVIGTWDDLDSDRQRRVLAECQHALLECDPTPLPNANSYSGSIVSESTCFARVADLCHESYVLDGVQIERWLQSTLAISTSYDDSLVSRCHLADPVATERVLVKELNRCLSFQPQSIFFLDTLPPAIWTEHLSGMFAEVAANDSYALAGRTVLLRQLILRNRRCVLPILTRWINEPNQDKRIVAVDLLLPTDPELVWDEFCKQIQAGGKEAFLKMGHILAEPHGLNPALSSWKAELIEELHDMLMAAFPPNTDPVRESGVAFGYGPEDAYRDLRNRLAPLLFSRGTEADRAALQRMAKKSKSTRDWYNHVKAQAAAGAVLEDLLPEKTLAKQTMAPFPKVARLLDVAVYRLLRTVADLQAVIAEEIVAIASDSKDHLSCLYDPRKTRKAARRTGQRHLQEDALQAYFHCRLKDRLGGRVLDHGTKVILNREPLTIKDQRLDIKVQALNLGGTVETVVIELKWSDHPDVSTSLRTQLGEEYLVNARLTHGIYLVGWSIPGKWKDTSPRPADSSSIDAWRRALTVQAEDFSRANPGVAILSLVIDLSWPPKSRKGLKKKPAKAKISRSPRPSKRKSRDNERATRTVARSKPRRL
jgi:hypothetical protein